MRRSGGCALALALLLAGCGGGDPEDSNRIRGDTLTIYSSGPRHGESAAAGAAVFAGQQRALREAGGRAGGRRIRLVRLSATRPGGDSLWDPGLVEANADRARKDPSAIAYLGELDSGGSAISLPVTNRAQLLQVSPLDGLTSLTKAPPGRPRAGPERYYPTGTRTFARLRPNDLVVAAGIRAQLPGRGAKPAAILHGEGIADRELTAVLVNRLRRTGAEPTFIEVLRDDVEAVRRTIRRLTASRPAAVVLLGTSGPATSAALAALAGRKTRMPVVGGDAFFEAAPPPGLADLRAVTPVLPSRAQPAAGRRVLADISRKNRARGRPEALYGYAAMRLVLTAIDRAGPDRLGVARAARAPGIRDTVLGPVSLDGAGDVSTRRLAVLRIRAGRIVLERVLP